MLPGRIASELSFLGYFWGVFERKSWTGMEERKETHEVFFIFF